MKALIWREFREQRHWCALFFVLTAMVLVFLSANMNSPVPFMTETSSNTWLFMTTWLPAIMGLVLGLLQTIPERRPDHWALIVHRPVSRWIIFVSKVVSGLAILCLSVVIPNLIAILWFTIPGHMAAPFYREMALPVIADLLSGMVYYFTGLLIGTRETKWFGSRLLPLGLPILVSMATQGVPEFWQAALLAIVGMVISFHAAWLAFQIAPATTPSTMLGHGSLGVTLTGGITLIAWMLVGCVVSVLPTTPITSEYYVHDDNGKILRVRKVNARVVEVGDLAGILASPARIDAINRGAERFYDLTPLDSTTDQRTITYRSLRRVLYFHDRTRGPTIWCYSIPERLFLEFDRQSRQLVGGIGPDGYFSTVIENRVGQLPDGFAESLHHHWPIYAWSVPPFQLGDTISHVDFSKLELQKMVDLEPGEVLDTSYDLDAMMDVVTDRRLLQFRRDGSKTNLVVNFNLPGRERPVPGWFISSYRRSESDRPVEYLIGDQADMRHSSPIFVTRVNEMGQVLEQLELPPLPQRFGGRTTTAVVLAGLAPFRHITFWIMQSMTPLSLDDSAKIRTSIVTAMIASLLAAIGIVLTSRRLAMQKSTVLMWGVLALVMGPAIFALRRSMIPIPTREPCPNCGNDRLVTRQPCEHCSSPWPAPSPRGIEIFA